jgi:hypothetical protein
MGASAEQRERVAARRQRVADLRERGLTFQQIADRLGLATASAAVMDLTRHRQPAQTLLAPPRPTTGGKRPYWPCAECGRPMWGGVSSLPPGQRRCHPCRRARPTLHPFICEHCQRPGESRHKRQRFCDRRCAGAARRGGVPWRTSRKYSPGATTALGYGAGHQQQRAALAPAVDRGEWQCQAIVCLQPSRQIFPGQRWDLGHTEDRLSYTGPEHARCNRAEGAKRGNRERGGGGGERVAARGPGRGAAA